MAESPSCFKTVEAERISVDHVAHLKPSDGGSAATQCKFSVSSCLQCSQAYMCCSQLFLENITRLADSLMLY